MPAIQIFTGAACGCRRGLERDNCPACEGTGRRLDFAAIRERAAFMRAAQEDGADMGAAAVVSRAMYPEGAK